MPGRNIAMSQAAHVTASGGTVMPAQGAQYPPHFLCPFVAQPALEEEQHVPQALGTL